MRHFINLINNLQVQRNFL